MEQVTIEVDIPQRHHAEVIRHLRWIDSGLSALSFGTHDPHILEFEYHGPQPVADIRQQLREAATRLGTAVARIPVKTYYRSDQDTPAGCSRVYEQLLARGWVVPVANGCHVYRGLMSTLYHGLDRTFRNQAHELGVTEHKFPTLIGLPTLERAGYLNGFAHQANFVFHLPANLEAVRRFKGRLHKGAAEALRGSVTGPSHALSPTVCFQFYQSIEGYTLAQDAEGCTAVSACYRHEGCSANDLQRLHEFNMREIIFVGTPQVVLARRDALLACQKRMLEMCSLAAVVETASDPFFVDLYESKRLYQISFDLKYEVRARLPALDDWLAIGSVNYHQDFFGKAFDIRQPNGEPAHSCCLGFGLDRWCFAVFAQHGLQPAKWPRQLQYMVQSEPQEMMSEW